MDKDKQLDQFRVNNDKITLTTNQGVPLSNTEDSLKAGDRGPTLMEDFHFREKMTHFDHERIPERVVHARGFGAHGYFQVYEPMAEYTMAKFLQDPSVKTPVFVRFSTVVGSRGSADTVRDARGFATKFYTEDGNYDLVANNIPVFFIQDAMKFPDLVHAIKPEPHNEIPQASGAHDTFWDFVANNTETAHMVMWLMSDRAIPRSLRMMEGFGVHAFRLVNAQGKARFVKFTWKPTLGAHSIVWEEAQKLAGMDPDYNRRDLWEAIEQGNYPEFELCVQLIEEEDEFKFDFDVLDPTKLWPEELVPLKPIGKMTLNRNQDNFFAETEQVAFHPGHVVPGIDFSNDPLLQGRLFSYQDTQLIRLGGPNFHQIPINRSVAPVHNNQRDGYNRMTIDQGQVAYHRNSLQGNSPKPDPHNGYKHYQEKVDGHKVRNRSESFNDHYSQATLFWNSMSDIEKKHIIDAFRFEVGKVTSKDVQRQVIEMFNNVDGYLASEIAKGVGIDPPASNIERKEPSLRSTNVSQLNTVKTAKTRKVLILADNGFKYDDVDMLMEGLNEAEATAEIVSHSLGEIVGDNGQTLNVNKTFLTIDSVMYDALFIPGGKENADGLMTENKVMDFIKEAYRHCKTIGATNEGLEILKSAGIVNDSGGEIYSKHGVVAIKDQSDKRPFISTFIDSVAQHRHWGRQLM